MFKEREREREISMTVLEGAVLKKWGARKGLWL